VGIPKESALPEKVIHRFEHDLSTRIVDRCSVSILDKKPADAKSIVKGPFATKAEAEKAMKEAETAKPAAPPSGK
jgi:hypothetical protein